VILNARNEEAALNLSLSIKKRHSSFGIMRQYSVHHCKIRLSEMSKAKSTRFFWIPKELNLKKSMAASYQSKRRGIEYKIW